MKARLAAPEPTHRPSASGVWIAVVIVAAVSLGMLGLAFSRATGDTSLSAHGGGPLVERPAGAEALLPPPTRRDGDPEGVAPAPEPPPTPSPDPLTLADASRRVPIELYSASWCSACASAHRWLDDNHVAYEEIDVDRRPGARDQLAALNPRRTLPTFDIDGDVLVGFDPSRLSTAIHSAAARHVD